MNEVDQIRSWVIPIDFFNHSAIVLQIDRQNDKPPSPIKFNPLWLEEEDFRNLVVQEGLGMNVEQWKGRYLYSDMHELFFVEFPCLLHKWLKRKDTINLAA